MDVSHPKGPRHRRAQPRWDPHRAMAWGPHLAPDASPSPIYSPSHENPKKKSRYSTKSSVAAVILNLRSEEF